MMGKVTPFRKRTRWTQASDYGATPSRKSVNWFPVVLVALPLAAFTAVFFAGGPPGSTAMPVAQQGGDTERASFGRCTGRLRVTCVVDGDTTWYQGTKIRIADIDTPEVSNPGCANEARLGARATMRLQVLLNEGAFTLAPNPDGRDTDKYGRALRVVTRDGESLGDTLVSEGLAEQWGAARIAWC
ncbi:thermonuclease family protein [Altererythrobacter sp.]|nr:thermonuclease family protein [Altererythrobacter sp.]